MYQRLTENEHKKVFYNYELSVNNLYSLYCEMKDIENTINDVFEKAKLLDEYYKEKQQIDTEKYNDVRQFIIKEYKLFNPEYGKGKNTFTREYVANELAKEGCELISDYKDCNTKIYYRYKDKTYYTTFKQWRHNGHRPHIYYEHINDWKQVK